MDGAKCYLLAKSMAPLATIEKPNTTRMSAQNVNHVLVVVELLRYVRSR